MCNVSMLMHMPVPEETPLQNTSEIPGGKSQWLLTYSGNIFYCNEASFEQEPFQSWVLLQYVLCLVSVCRNSTCHGHVIIFLLLKLNNPGGDSLCKYSV